MYKQQIIDAIQEQIMLAITFRKENEGNYVSKNIAPYDIYPQSTKKNPIVRDILLGYSEGDYNSGEHVSTIYLDNIQSIVYVGRNFDGYKIKRLINPKRPPMVARNW